MTTQARVKTHGRKAGRPVSGRRRALSTLERWSAVIAFVVVIGGWEAYVRAAGVSPIVLPPPSLVVSQLYDGIVYGTFIENLGVTLYETVLGFGIAALVGILLGALVAELPWARKAVYPYVVAFQTIPMIALAPLLVIWFGFGLTSKVLAAAIVAFFPIVVNTIEGVAGTDQQRIDMIRAMGAGRLETFTRVKVPSALPFIFAGLNTGIVLALLGAVVGEFMGAKAGLGNLMLIFNAELNIAGSFAVLILLSLCGFSLHLVTDWLRNRVVFWVPRKK
jgi:NitT/TauT family transport system permease protein